MTPLIFNLGPTELIIILVIVLLLFGGSRLAGLGKSTGRALKEFKEETKDLGKKSDDAAPVVETPPAVTQWPQQQPPANPQWQQQPPPVANPQWQQPPAAAEWQQPPAGNGSVDPASTDVRKDA